MTALTREQADALAKDCLVKRRRPGGVLPQGDTTIPMPDWVLDAVMIASGAAVDVPVPEFPGGAYVDGKPAEVQP